MTTTPEEEAILGVMMVYDYNEKKSGRRTRCTPELTLEIATYIVKGSSANEASRLAGLNPASYFQYMKRGRTEFERLKARGVEDEDFRYAHESEMPFLSFFYAMQKAIPMRKILLLDRINKAGEDPRNWQANAWLLERIHPDEFGRKTRVDIKQVDWRDEVIDLIKQGIEYDMVMKDLGEDEAEKLFERAGVEIPGAGEGGEPSE